MKIINSNFKIVKFMRVFINRLMKEKWNYLGVFLRIPVNYLTKFIRSPFFVFKNKKYKYFNHMHHRTWMTERAIEIPIIIGAINSSKGSFLEIGNVLRHYVDITHDVVDKYEKANNVINEDVATYTSKKKYDLIVSISTIEHVGWDEKKSEDKIPKSINNLKKLLKKDGRIVITVPINYNPWLDKLLEKGDLFDEIYFMKRKLFNRWVSSNWEEIKNCGFNEDARGLAILIIKK